MPDTEKNELKKTLKLKRLDSILPFGESFLPLLNNPQITKSDLQGLLRRRGVYVSSEDKGGFMSIMLQTIPSPSEYEHLISLIEEKEDSPKMLSSTILSVSDKDLSEVINIAENINLAPKREIKNYEFLSKPTIEVDKSNKNIINVSYSIKRTDYSKSWTDNERIFDGKVEVEKDKRTQSIKIRNIYTSEETKTANIEIIQNLVDSFKKVGEIEAASKPEKIYFDSFDNENRIKYFLELRGDTSSSISYEDIGDVQFCLDTLLAPEDSIEWMKNKTRLSMEGKQLEETFFLKNETYYKYFYVWYCKYLFSFENNGISGKCEVIYEFDGFKSNEISGKELKVNIGSNVVWNGEYSLTQKTRTKSWLLKYFDNHKHNIYKKIKK